VGSVTLSTSFGSLGCRSIGPRQQPIHTLTDRGFAPTTRLNVVVTREIASATSAEQICFNSDVAFLSQESPTVKRAGSGLLLGCARVANVAPCVTSSRQVGANIVVKFVVPGGDPRFYIELPKGRQAWLDGAGVATAGKRYSASVQALGGRAPLHWNISSGKLPGGLTLNKTSGALSGTPTAKGKFSFSVRAVDSEQPPKAATLPVPMIVK